MSDQEKHDIAIRETTACGSCGICSSRTATISATRFTVSHEKGDFIPNE